MAKFLLQPKWIIFTLLVPLGMALCLLAANWQYHRHVNRSALDALIRTNAAAPVVPIDEVVAPGAAMPPDEAYRSVSAVGTFEPGTGVLVRRRVLEGAAGFWVVDSLRTPTGAVLQVLRGWTPMASDARATPSVPPPPAGEVTVAGWLQESQTMPSPAPDDLPAGQVAALDTAVLADGQPAYLPYLVATAMAPPDPAALKPVPVPTLGLGPHLAYSWQWLFFAAMLPIGWVILARREYQSTRDERARSEQVGAAVGHDG